MALANVLRQHSKALQVSNNNNNNGNSNNNSNNNKNELTHFFSPAKMDLDWICDFSLKPFCFHVFNSKKSFSKRKTNIKNKPRSEVLASFPFNCWTTRTSGLTATTTTTTATTICRRRILSRNNDVLEKS